MSYYDYDKFLHPVPGRYILPKGTQVRRVAFSDPCVETFFTTQYDAPVHGSNGMKYFLTYDITKPKPPEEINTVIYNVIAVGIAFPVAVYQGSRIWSAFSDTGERTTLYTPEIEYFDTTPPKEEAGDDDE